MTNEQAIIELITEVKFITQALQEIHNQVTFIDTRVTALEAKHSNVSDALNVCFMRQKEEVEDGH